MKIFSLESKWNVIGWSLAMGFILNFLSIFIFEEMTSIAI